MELRSEKGLGHVNDAFVGVIILVVKPFAPIFGERFCIDREAMVLRCDVAAPAATFATGLVLTAMAVFQLIGSGAGGESQDL